MVLRSSERVWQTERTIQRAVVKLFRSVGCEVAVLSQVRPSRVARGLPDLYVFPPRLVAPFWMEVKGLGGKPTEDQLLWQEACELRGVPCILGGVPEAKAYLQRIGLLGEGA